MSERSFKSNNKPDKISATSSATLRRQKSDNSHTSVDRFSPTILDNLHSAASEASQPLDANISRPLSRQFNHDFSRIRIHSGPASATAAESIGARAYTLGNRIHLGNETHKLSPQERNHLLVHEVVHTVQQGGQVIAPSLNLNVGNPNGAAEQEAKHIADSFFQRTLSRSLGLRKRQPSSIPGQHIARSVTPQIQRDLIGKKKLTDGTFNYNLTTESHAGAKNGMKGTIKFKASKKAPDSTNIKLLQVVKVKDLGTKKDYVWTGGEADRNKTQTTKNKKKYVKGGYFVDHSAAAASTRTAKADTAVSPYYRDYWPNATHSQNGSKQGNTIQEASLWDYPGGRKNVKFSFETAAKAADTGYVYAMLKWGFTIKDAATGKVKNEYAKGHRSPSKTFSAAVKEFNEFYKNPGSSKAP